MFITGDHLVIAVDFDGVIVDFAFPNIGKLKPGAKKALEILKNLGCKIIIFSGRTDMSFKPNLNGTRLKEMIQFLNDNGIIYDDIWTKPGKPVCDLYIDDKAIKFTNWRDTLLQILRILEVK